MQGSLVWKASCVLSLSWLVVVEPWLAGVLPGGGVAEASKKAPAPKRFPFKIDPRTPLAELLPTPPDLPPALLPWLVDDLSRTPEIFFQKPVAFPEPKEPASPTTEERTSFFERFQEMRDNAMSHTAHRIAKINHMNQQGRDRFLIYLLRERPDLAGLPFAMGDDCRTKGAVSRALVPEVNMVRNARAEASPASRSGDGPSVEITPAMAAKAFWKAYPSVVKEEDAVDRGKPASDQKTRARIAALMQMLAPESVEQRKGLVEYLKAIEHPEATKA